MQEHGRAAIQLLTEIVDPAVTPYAELSDPEKLERLWHLLPGYVCATARREGVTPHGVLERLRERVPDDGGWWAGLADFDAEVRATLADAPGNINTTED